MVIHDRRIIALPRPGGDERPLEAASELKIALDTVYEEALGDGMTPECAFETILDWLTGEVQKAAAAKLAKS
jgi:hypothetical protein